MVTPVLDLMQTMPTFCYLAPMALFFGIGPAAAVVLTFIYALPPLVRITEHGIKSVSPTTVEAARSLGLTRSQMLRQVQLPMARRTIVVGINQCTMAALSMATIAALVDGPGSRQAGRLGAADPQRRRRRRWPAWRSCRWRSCSTAPRPRPASAPPGGPTSASVSGMGVTHRRRRARAAAAVGDRGRRQGPELPAPDPRRPLAPAGRAVRSRSSSSSGCRATTSRTPSSRTSARRRC